MRSEWTVAVTARLRSRGGFRKAGAALALAAALLAAGCSSPEEVRARHVASGDALFAQGQYEKARIEYLNALQIDGNDTVARNGAGAAFERLGDVRTAFGHYLGASRADASDVRSRVALGRLLVLSGNSEEAAPYVDEVLALDPASADGLGLRASLLALAGDLAGAEEAARRSVAADPANEIGVPLLASLLLRQDRRDEAEAVLAAGIARDPDSAGLRAVHAQVLGMLGRTAEQEAALLALSELEPEQVMHVVALARVKARSGDLDGARELMQGKADASGASLEMQTAHLQFLEAFQPDRLEAEFERLIAASPHGEDLELQRAAYLLRAGRGADAEAHLRRIAEFSTIRVALEAQTALAQLLIEQGKVDEAAEIVAEVRKESPTNQTALVISSLIAISKGAYEDAVADLRLAIRDAPEAALLRRLLGQTYLASDRPEMARQEFAAALDIAPADTRSLSQLAALELRQGNLSGALELAERMSVLPETSQEGLRFKYRALLGQERLDEAAEVAQLLDEAAPRDGAGPFFLGVVRQSQGDLAAAEAAYRRGLERQPGAVEPLSSVLRLMLDQGRLDDARALLAEQRAKAPANPMVVKFQGDVEARGGDLQKALALFREGLELDPGMVVAHKAIVAVHLTGGDWPAARTAYQAALTATHHADFYEDYGLQLQVRGEHAEAERIYREGLARYPDNRQMANNLAVLLADADATPAELDAAYELAREFHLSDNPAYLSTLGWVQFRRGELEVAVRLLRRAVALEEGSAELRYQLAEALAAAGQREEARLELDRALAPDGVDFPDIERARALRATL